MQSRILIKVRQLLSQLNPWPTQYSYDTLPPEMVRRAASLFPHVNKTLIDFSIREYDVNPYYQLVINNLMNHTVGDSPSIIGISDKVDDRHNDLVEDSYIEWMSSNLVGRSYRELRKQAALTGIGIGLPFKDENSTHDVKLSYKVIGANSLQNPLNVVPGDRIINGIQYDKNWEIERFFVRDADLDRGIAGLAEPKEYTIQEVIFWSRSYRNGITIPMPECYGAFTVYPYLRRYLQAVIQSEEFQSSFPMAVELDPKVYSNYSTEQREAKPVGSFEYEPGMIPTLKPGMKLAGLPHSVNAKDRQTIMQMFAATCALTVQMPKNLALGDSSNSNMASAQVDIQPWANKVGIDRFDMEPVFRKSFKDWWSVASLRLMPFSVRNAHPFFFPHLYVYPDLFEHPDPNKRASARALDLASGAETLNRMYSNRGLNFRREMQREAKSLGLTVEELIKIIVSTRSTNALSVLEINQGAADAN